MTMGAKIKERRKMRGMTQDEFGELLGVKKSAVAKWETGRVENIKRSTIERMAEILDCSPVYLMDFEDEQPEEIILDPPLTESERDLIVLCRELNEEGREMVLKHAEALAASGLYNILDQSGMAEKEA